MARFALADEDSAMATEPPAAEPPAAAAAPEPSDSGDNPAPQQPGDKKDKEKEKEKERDKERDKEREREKERDALTIEVCDILARAPSSTTSAHTATQDLTLPKSIITRLAKGVLPPNTQIQANAILALTKSATVFISHLANAYAHPLPPHKPNPLS